MSIWPSSTGSPAEEFAAFESRGLTGHPQLWEIDQSVMRAELRLWYDEEVLDAVARSSDSAAFEVTYGMPLDPDPHPLSRAEPVPLQVGERELQLSGRIDRLQWREDGAGLRRDRLQDGTAEGQEDGRRSTAATHCSCRSTSMAPRIFSGARRTTAPRSTSTSAAAVGLPVT